jgi:hypothetical protein
MKNSTLIALIGGLTVLLCCLCAGFAGVTYMAFSSQTSGFNPLNPTAIAGVATPASSEEALPTIDPSIIVPEEELQETPTAETPPSGNATAPAGGAPSAEAPPAAADNLRRITTAVSPREDLVDLALRFKGVKPDDAKVNCPALQDLAVGTTRKFTLSNQDNNTQFVAEARLEYKTENAYMWVQIDPEPVSIDLKDLKTAADLFQRTIYPTTRAFFGSETQPGVDCDNHIHVLHVQGVGSSVGGYFSSPDAYPKVVRSDSNEGQIYVIHAAPGYNGSDPGSDAYMSTMAHEFQHMISFSNAHAPDLWLEEGAAQFAERLNGYGSSIGTVFEFAAAPETQLNTWSEGSAGGNGPHYGAGYLFWSYLYDRFGEDVIKKLGRSPERSAIAFMKIMADEGITNPDTGKPLTFEEVFSDWVIANFNGKSDAFDKRYSYKTIKVPTMAFRGEYSQTDLPLTLEDTLAQFGTHYIQVRTNRKISVNFEGSRSVGLLPMRNNDNSFWWSGRTDVSNPRLTREFDLTNVQNATLKFKAFYRLERDYDYGYASVSADGGATWKLLRTKSCTTANPQNANLGCGWNGTSGTNDKEAAPRWLNEQADLSEYAGKKILVRFEVVTDAAVTREGIAIDDIEIPEISFSDNAGGDNGWTSEGFSRISNTLPQSWSVQAIVIKRNGTVEIRPLALDLATGKATLDIQRDASVRSVVLAISPTTQVTTEPASYKLTVGE